MGAGSDRRSPILCSTCRRRLDAAGDVSTRRARYNESDTVSRRDQGAGEAATVRNLSSIQELQEQFNRDEA
jgi:hypothetical protein